MVGADGWRPYAGSASFDQLRETVRDIMGFEYVVPAHQGRGAEHILFTAALEPGQIVLNNHHFDTTRAHVEARGAVAIDLGGSGHDNFDRPDPFKGRHRPGGAWHRPRAVGGGRGHGHAHGHRQRLRRPACLLENIRGAAALARRYAVPFFLDAARFAENAYFIQQREAQCSGWSVRRVVKAMFDEADGCTMSGKKDALANIGGLVGLRDPELYRKVSAQAVLFEGFPTYGGLAGRDLGRAGPGPARGQNDAQNPLRLRVIPRSSVSVDQPVARRIRRGAVRAEYLLPHSARLLEQRYRFAVATLRTSRPGCSWPSPLAPCYPALPVPAQRENEYEVRTHD